MLGDSLGMRLLMLTTTHKTFSVEFGGATKGVEASERGHRSAVRAGGMQVTCVWVLHKSFK